MNFAEIAKDIHVMSNSINNMKQQDLKESITLSTIEDFIQDIKYELQNVAFELQMQQAGVIPQNKKTVIRILDLCVQVQSTPQTASAICSKMLKGKFWAKLIMIKFNWLKLFIKRDW